jgi:hypothetical protein
MKFNSKICVHVCAECPKTNWCDSGRRREVYAGIGIARKHSGGNWKRQGQSGGAGTSAFPGLQHRVDVFAVYDLHEPCPYSLFRNLFNWHASKPVQPLDHTPKAARVNNLAASLLWSVASATSPRNRCASGEPREVCAGTGIARTRSNGNWKRQEPSGDADIPGPSVKIQQWQP